MYVSFPAFSALSCLTTPTVAAAAAAKSLQSCPALCDPIDSSPPGSPVPGILQARTLEWVAISFSNAWKWKVKVKSLSRVWLLATPWTAAYQAPSSMGFSTVSNKQIQHSCQFNSPPGLLQLCWLFCVSDLPGHQILLPSYIKSGLVIKPPT